MNTSSSHPLWWLRIPGYALIGLAAIWGIADLLGQLESLWIWFGIGILISMSIWAAVSAKAQQIVANIAKIFKTQPFKGVAIGALLTTVYGFAVYGILVPFKEWLQLELLVDPRIVIATALVVALLAAAPIVSLYKGTGISADIAIIKRAGWVLSFIIIGLVSFLTYHQPNRFFDPDTGEPTFMVAKDEGKMYYLDPDWCRQQSKGMCFSPATGEPLRPGTMPDAKRFSRKSWLKELESLFQSDTNNQTARPASELLVRTGTTNIPVVGKSEKVFVFPNFCIRWVKDSRFSGYGNYGDLPGVKSAKIKPGKPAPEAGWVYWKSNTGKQELVHWTQALLGSSVCKKHKKTEEV